MTKAFNPTRMEVARMRRMLTRRELAERIGVKPTTVSKWCHSLSEPKPEHVDALAKVLKWPRRFFFGDDIEIPENVSFRNATW